MSLTYGAIRDFDTDSVQMRSASPLVNVAVEAGATATGPIAVELRNQHVDASVEVLSVTFLDGEDATGCPDVTRVEVDCQDARASFGTTCVTSGQCAAGARCAAGSCAPDATFSPCEAPQTRKPAGRVTSMAFDLPIEPCTRLRLRTTLADAPGTVRFAVLGPSRDATVVQRIAPDLAEHSVSFLILLGDNISTVDENGLLELERIVSQLRIPVVVLAGEREMSPERGQQFLRRFGPHDHIWTVGSARFFAFFSASGTLGDRGLDRLDSFLRQLDGESDAPVIGVTHVPPLDPNDLRDNAFRSEIEALQVMSLLEQRGVSQLYAGGLGTGRETVHGVQTRVTTGSGTVANRDSEWLLVELNGQDITTTSFPL